MLQSATNPENTNVEALIARNAKLEKEVLEQRETIDYLKFELLKLKQLFGGSRSERFVASDNSSQLPLGLDVQAIAEADVKKTPVAPHERTSVELKPKKHKGRIAFPSHLERVVERLDPESKPEDARQIGIDVTETLEYKEATLFVKRIERPKYASKNKEGILMAAMPERFLGRSMFGNSFAAHAIVSKYIDHQPEYRQLKSLKRQDIHVPSSSMNDIFAQSAKNLTVIYDLIGQEVFTTRYIQADETTNRVLTNENPGKSHKGYYWAYRSPEKNMVYFDYREGRDGEGPRDKLKNFSGILQCDGFSVYDQFGKRDNITLVHCWAHARRKFKEALEVDKRAEGAVLLIQSLYDIERFAREKEYSAHQRLGLRKEKSRPILDELKSWLNAMVNQVGDKDPLAKAMAYTVKRWDGLSRYLENGLIEIDNNWVENSIRPITLGRKNFLFAGSHDGACRSALFYTLLGTCELRGVNPYRWLKMVMDKLPTTKSEDSHTLLP